MTSPITSEPNPRIPTYTLIFLSLIRFVEHSTDIVVSLNLPIISNPADAQDQVSPIRELEIQEIASKVAKSLEVKDWNLFSGD